MDLYGADISLFTTAILLTDNLTLEGRGRAAGITYLIVFILRHLQTCYANGVH